MTRSDVLVCSFYTSDEYYSSFASALRAGLDARGIPHELHEVHKGPDDDWADMTRRKVSILHQACEAHPDTKVFWIDVDCFLLDLPDSVADFSADLVGFQRGFASPLSIGYKQRTRFWEPCFFGINSTPGGRAFIAKAAELEASLEIKATDDYFFEEAWRALCATMSFQVIPSAAVIGRGVDVPGVESFFRFGASGNVAEFKDKVVQHEPLGAVSHRSPTEAATDLTRRTARAVYRRLPAPAARTARRTADRLGITHRLTNADPLFGAGPTADATTGSVSRRNAVRAMIEAGQNGELARVEVNFGRIVASGGPSAAERAALEAAMSYTHYRQIESDGPPLPLSWWPRPFPGNFGDWLSPYIVSALSTHAVSYQPPSARKRTPHLVSVGSIGRFVEPSSVVVGTGISEADTPLAPDAHYVSLRGPVTAAALRASGGPDVESFGDPGALVRRLVPIQRAEGTNGRVALVRHFKHADLPLILPEGMDEISVLTGSPGKTEQFLRLLGTYDSVVTSAMHVLIACQSYGIPCALVTFTGAEQAVHGTGVKYGDYARGVGLDEEIVPVPVRFDLRRQSFDAMTTAHVVPDAKLDEIEGALRTGVSVLLERLEG